MHNITWNGVNSETIGLHIERAARIIRPRRKAEVVSIAGRNGDLVMMQDAWDNYEQPYDIWFGNGTNLSAETGADAVSAWLHSASGYARLEDTYEPDIYRMAFYVNEQDIENAITEYGRETIRFNCRPERFLKSGETPITLSTSNVQMQNPTQYASRPLIRINGSGSGTLTIAGTKTYSVSITGISSYMYLDCDEQNAYKTAGTNLNNKVTITNGVDFPRLNAGANTITWTGGITSVVITPRWFKI